MRAHFTICAKRPTASDQVDRRQEFDGQARPPTGAANAVGLARQPTATRLRAHLTGLFFSHVISGGRSATQIVSSRRVFR